MFFNGVYRLQQSLNLAGSYASGVNLHKSGASRQLLLLLSFLFSNALNKDCQFVYQFPQVDRRCTFLTQLPLFKRSL